MNSFRNNSVRTDFMLLCINRNTDTKSPLKFQRFVQRDTNSRARTRRVSTSRACLEYTEYILTRALRSGSALALCAFGHFRLRSAVFVLRSRTNHDVRPRTKLAPSLDCKLPCRADAPQFIFTELITLFFSSFKLKINVNICTIINLKSKSQIIY